MEQLRQLLLDYYGTAIFSGNPTAMTKLAEIENATEEALIQLANEIGLHVQP